MPHGAAPISIVAAALLAELDGDLAAAGALVERAVALTEDLRFRPQLRTWSLDLVRLALAANDEPTARRATTALEALSSMSGVRSVRAAAQAACAMVERDAGGLEEAVAAFAESPRLVATAQATEELGRVHLERANTAEAIDAFRRALAIWEAVGAPHDARRTAGCLRQLGVRTRPIARSGVRVGWDSLSPTEATVAVLIGEGMTNAQIATRLVVSPRTIETHVAHVLAKLGVGARAGVARLVAERSH
jgi:DNA-binding CsgD family transcriptional regulator